MALRLVEAIVSAGRGVPELPEELGAVAAWSDHLDGGLMMVRVLVRSEQTEGVIRALEAAFQGSPAFRVVILEAQATIPVLEEPPPPPPAPESAESKEPPPPPKDPQRVACAELVEKLSASATVNRIFILTVVLSTIVAAIGLINDSVAVIVGAMVIAPLLGPNLTLSLATTLGDVTLARRALKVNAAGCTLALALAILIGAIFAADPRGAEIAARTRVGTSDIVVALAAGSAGALALTTGLSEAVVGVMVAVALLPPLTTAGLLLGVGDWHGAGSAFLLTASNIVCINLAGVATFLWQGVRPNRWWEEARARKMVRVAAAIWVGLLALLVLVILLAQR